MRDPRLGPPTAAALASEDVAAQAEPRAMGSRSLVAGINAMFRDIESRRAEGDRILHDPFAAAFAEHDPRVLLVRAARFIVPGLHRLVSELQTAHCIRHRAIDALVETAVAQGVTQVVIVGAGYDMRAFRLGPRWPQVRWFEVDHPATQARKLLRLSAVTATAPDVARVAGDLQRHALSPLLATVDFDTTQPTCFVLEGLVHYLSMARLRSLLLEMASAHAPRMVIASFIRTDMFESAPSLFVRAVQSLREVPRLHLMPTALAGLATSCGFADTACLSNAEQATRFAPIAMGRTLRLSQDVAVLTNRLFARPADAGAPIAG